MPMLSPSEQRLQDLMAEALTLRAGIDAVAVFSRLPAAVREVASRLRALQIADLVHLRGMSMTVIADTISEQAGPGGEITGSTIRLALKQYGPREYLGVEQTGPRSFRLVRVPVTGSPGTFRELHALMDKGVRFAPARWETTDDIDPKALWNRIGG